MFRLVIIKLAVRLCKHFTDCVTANLSTQHQKIKKNLKEDVQAIPFSQNNRQVLWMELILFARQQQLHLKNTTKTFCRQPQKKSNSSRKAVTKQLQVFKVHRQRPAFQRLNQFSRWAILTLWMVEQQAISKMLICKCISPSAKFQFKRCCYWRRNCFVTTQS